jgi:hypothetical protein
MRGAVKQAIQMGLLVFILVWVCIGCASLNNLNKKIKETLGFKPVPARPVEPEPSVPSEPPPATPRETQVSPPKEIEEEKPQEPAYFMHTVRWPGESLSIIAKWYTGDFENWRVLAHANPGIDPNLIFVGNKIRIPENLLKTRKPIPERFVTGFGPKPRRKELPPETPPPAPSEDEEEILFGPKQYPEK